MDIVSKVITLLLTMLSKFVIAFLPRSKCLLILWLQSPSAVILEPRKIKSANSPHFPIYLPWSDGTGCHDLRFFECIVLSHPFHSSLTFIKRLFSSSSLSVIRVSSAYLRLPGGLHSIWLQRVRHNWATKTHSHAYFRECRNSLHRMSLPGRKLYLACS